MPECPAVDYWIDAADRVAKVGDGWLDFARENGAPALTPDSVEGRPLGSFISDLTTTHLWELLLRRAWTGVPVRVPLRCDAPALRRVLTLDLSRDGDLIRLRSTEVERTPRPRVHLRDTAREARGTPLSCCSWCERFERAPGVWVEVEVLLREARLFEESVLPPVSHGVCSACLAAIEAEAGLDAVG